MGSFPPTDPEYGRDCLLCYPPGETPLTFAFSMVGVEIGADWVPGMPLPPNGIHFVTQDPVFNCIWKSIHAPTEVRYYACHVGDTIFTYEQSPGIEFFRSNVGPGCIKFHTNDYDTPLGNWYWGGTVLLMPTWVAVNYVSGYTPIVDPDPQFFFSPVPGNKVVIRYTDSWGDTNISMLVDLS